MKKINDIINAYKVQIEHSKNEDIKMDNIKHEIEILDVKLNNNMKLKKEQMSKKDIKLVIDTKTGKM